MHNYTPTPTVLTTVPVVDDGDAPSAANLSAADKANADATAFLMVHNLINLTFEANNEDTVFETFTTSSYVESADKFASLEGCEIGDRIHVVFTGSASQVSTPGATFCSLFATDDADGTPTTPAEILGAAVKYLDATTDTRGLSLNGVWVVTKAGTTRVILNAKITTTGGGKEIVVSGQFAIVLHHFRPLP